MSESYKRNAEEAASEHDATHLEIGVGERAVPLRASARDPSSSAGSSSSSPGR